MLSIYNLTKQYSGQTLFEDISFNISPGERVGLVGRNGHGKTTLFRIIADTEHPDSGTINIPNNYKLGYLKQNFKPSKGSVLEEACLGLTKNEKDDHWKVKKILSGLGFSEQDFSRSPSEFSSGYQMRIELAKLLASDSNLLLLDEPTNFLDIISIRWLEKFLRQWKGELLLISHDRTFMDNIITHVMGIHRKSLRKMPGKTENFYFQIRSEEDLQERRRLNDGKIRKKEEEFINKFRAKARRASQAQARKKRLEKMNLIDKLDNISSLSFDFNYETFSAKHLMEAKDICFNYNDKNPYLIDNFNLAVESHDRVCIIGQNGKGKTTLLKLLAKKLKPITGEIKKHPNLKIGYFKHGNTSELNEKNTIEKEINNCLNIGEASRTRQICGAMMFSGDNALKKISILSGGEKCRVMLGKILAAPANLLMLDEPTHHLDIESCTAMIEAVKRFKGGSIIVTHDENFLRKVANKLVILQSGKITFFPGTYDEFLERIGWDNEEHSPEQEKKEKHIDKKELRRIKAQQIKERNKILKPLEKKINILEKKIHNLEQEYAENEKEMIDASLKQDAKKIQELNQSMVELKKKIDGFYEELISVNMEYEKENEILRNTSE